jgi:hypothetical protein
MKSQTFSAQSLLRCARWTGLGAVICLLSFTASSAALLPIGGVLFPAPVGPAPTGTIAAGPLVSNFSAPTFTGVLTSEVFTNDPTNPFGLNDMTFVYQILNTSANPAADIARMTVGDFTGFQTDAYFVPRSGNLDPAYFDRPSASTVGISFAPIPLGSGVIFSGQTSDLLVVHTDSKVFDVTHPSLIDSTTTNNGPLSYAPTTNIPSPEPSTLVLAGLAALGLFVAARRKAK